MNYEGREINQNGIFYYVTLGDKTFYRAKLSNLETIIYMYNQGGELREKVNKNIPEQREEWLSITKEEELATGRVVEVLTKTPVHPDANYSFTFGATEFVPEQGKSAKAVRERAQFIAEHPIDKAHPSLLDRVLKVGGVSIDALSKIKMPTMPQIGLGGKGLITAILIFMAVIVGLVALGYSGLGGAAGEVTKGEYKKRRK